MKILNKSEVSFLDKMGDDLAVVNAARVSFNKESEAFVEQDEKLIKYLAKHNHWTPFGHVTAKFRVKAPIFVARQLVKHQVGLVWNEVSRRYIDNEPEFYIPDYWHKRPDKSVKQGSGDTFDGDSIELYTSWALDVCREALVVYNHMLKDGVAPEEARMVLPLNTMTEWIWTGSLAAWSRVCKLRLDSHAQGATREAAQQINEHMEKVAPVSWKALNEG